MKRKVVNVGVYERGLFSINAEPMECDFCDEKKICASINTISKDVICVCQDCLKEFVNAFNVNENPKDEE